MGPPSEACFNTQPRQDIDPTSFKSVAVTLQCPTQAVHRSAVVQCKC